MRDTHSAEQKLAGLMGGRGFTGATPMPSVVIPALRPGDIHLGDTAANIPIGISLAGLIDGRVLIQGNSGAGKSMLLRRLFEQAFGQVQQLVVDADGEFSTLAEIFDVAIFTAADVLRVGVDKFALHLRQHRYSAVLDLSDATSEDQLRVIADLAAGLVNAPEQYWHPMLVLVDEAQRFAPHYDTGDVDPETRKRAISALADMMGRGRKRGIAGVIATQRLAETSKAVVAKATNIIAGRTIFDRDLERAGALLGFTIGQSRPLRTLADGEFLCLGPAIAGPKRVRFRTGPVKSRHKGRAPALLTPPAISAKTASALLQQLPSAATPASSTPSMRGKVRAGWSDAEDRIVVDGYAFNLKLPEIATKLADAGHRLRSLSAISTRGQMLGLTGRQRAMWTPEEDAIVRKAYNEKARIADIVAKLRSAGFERERQAVQMRAIALGISGDRVNYWTETEKAIAVAGLSAGKRHSDILAEMREAGYHRGVTALSKFAALQNFARPTENPWTDEHLRILRECYSIGKGPKEAQRRTGRPYQSIVSKASMLGISVNRVYSNDERALIEKMHRDGATLVAVAQALKKPYPNVARITAKMGLDFNRAHQAERAAKKSSTKKRRKGARR